MSGGSVTASGDGHSWHQSSAAMTAVHMGAALAVAWLLHQADAAVAAALAGARTARRVIVAARVRLRRLWAKLLTRPVRRVPPVLRRAACRRTCLPIGSGAPERALPRRGPPEDLVVPVPSPSSGRVEARPA
ncbi:hypothetical protein GCM10010269_34360 [Streptomyces humidus]|uniref:Uncharacterized protein n=2 Tax=Streptomyces humidus TaxID=52259 RepID=A0A918L416_9ACTN|nr:hypothetical protein GCM10010269_34360 [Streptomyces humidus]